MQICRSVEEVRGSLILNENGSIKNSIKNCLTVLQSDPVLSGAIRYNIMTERVDIVKSLWWKKTSRALNETDINYLLLYMEEKYSLTVETKIEKAISIVADKNQYHPVRDYLNRLEWDGTERIRYVLHRFLGSDINEYTYEAMRLFLLGAISRAYKPGCKFDTMLCLTGGQGAGKSTFFQFLAVKDEWFSDDLKKMDDENVFRKIQGHWIIEMSEMIATANAKSIEEIKSFLSRRKETYKVPYEKQASDRLRQCVFGGTSNTLDFLPLDRSGNRRFLPVMVYPDKAEVHILENVEESRQYIDQLWAEAMVLYRSGKIRLTLSKEVEQYLKELQKEFMPEDTKAGLIQAYLENFTGKQVCSKQLYKEALNHPFDEPKQWEIREINEIMNNSVKGWKQFSNPRYFSSYGRQRGWERDNSTDATEEKSMDGFVELIEEEAKQMELPF
ncbi:MAG: VapE domain-containing protein [Monoglobales bacterium]